MQTPATHVSHHLPASRRSRRPLVRFSPAQAWKLAVRHTRDLGFFGADVREGKQVRRMFGVRRDEVWVVYREHGMEEQPALCSSYVAVVCKRTGAVLYVGDAQDEG